MLNPWNNSLEEGDRLVLSIDVKVIDALAERRSNPDFQVRDHLWPEPFIGDPDASVYLLSLNPGYSKGDDEWHRRPDFKDVLRRNLTHSNVGDPFYYLDDRFKDSPGGRWWAQRSRWLTEHLDESEKKKITQRLFCVELFPYHSTKYWAIPKSIQKTQVVPSTEYSVELVKAAIRQEKHVIVMRAGSQWSKLVSELAKSSPFIHRLRNKRNVSLSPRNLESFEVIKTHLLR